MLLVVSVGSGVVGVSVGGTIEGLLLANAAGTADFVIELDVNGDGATVLIGFRGWGLVRGRRHASEGRGTTSSVV